MTQDSVAPFNRDLERTILLGAYIGQWGIPELRVLATQGDVTIEVYSFPPRGDEGVHRFATVGVSSAPTKRAERAGFELLLPTRTWRSDWGSASQRRFACPRGGRPAPSLSTSRSVRLEALKHMRVGARCVCLLWLIPVHEVESAFVAKGGADEFHRRMKQSRFSLVDPNRPADAMDVTVGVDIEVEAGTISRVAELKCGIRG